MEHTNCFKPRDFLLFLTISCSSPNRTDENTPTRVGPGRQSHLLPLSPASVEAHRLGAPGVQGGGRLLLLHRCRLAPPCRLLLPSQAARLGGSRCSGGRGATGPMPHLTSRLLPCGGVRPPPRRRREEDQGPPPLQSSASEIFATGGATTRSRGGGGGRQRRHRHCSGGGLSTCDNPI
jgi:hypothetical protein